MMNKLRALISNRTGGGNTGVTYTTEPDPHGTTGLITPITLTSGTPAWKDGSYAEIEDATAEDRWITHVKVWNANDAGTTYYDLDIAIGAEEAENVVSSIPAFEQVDSAGLLIELAVPVFVPKGSRIAARISTSVATKTIQIVLLCAKGLAGL